MLDKADEHRLASLDLAPTTEPAGRAQAFKLETRWRMLLGRVGLLLIVLAIWQFGAMLLQIPNFLLPKPTEIAGALARGLLEPPASSDSLYFNVGVTLLEAIAGFAIGSSAGLLLALLLASSPRLERLMLPYVLGFQSVPKVAIAPLIIIWFGVGINSKIALVALLAFFPLLINSLFGLKNVDPDRIELLRSLNASRWKIYRFVTVPSALPAIFAGLEMAILFSLTGTIVGEFLAGQAGLGVLIQQNQRNFFLAGTFAALIMLSLLGVLLLTLLRAIRRRVLFWEQGPAASNN